MWCDSALLIKQKHCSGAGWWEKFKQIDVVFNDIKPIPGYGYDYGSKLKNGRYKRTYSIKGFLELGRS